MCVTERERERKQKKERVREREQERNKRVHDRVSHIRWAGELMEVRSLFRCVHASLYEGLSVGPSVGPSVGRLRVFFKPRNLSGNGI